MKDESSKPRVIGRLHHLRRERSQRTRWRRLAPRVAAGVAVVLLAVALFVPVEMTVTAPGRVVPSERVKAVQHLEGGIIREVLVREGQTVHPGDVLVRVDLGAQGPNLEEIQAKVASMHAARQRLTSEAGGAVLTEKMFEPDTPPAVQQTEMLTFNARVLEHQGQLAAARAQVEMHSSRALEVQAKIDGLLARQSILEREYDIAAQLAKERLVPELEAMQRQKELEANKSELASARQGLSAARAAAQEARSKVAETEGRFRRRASEELLTTERQIATASEELNRAQNQRDRATLSAPIHGVVKGLRSGEPGWVVKPGETILEVVPADAEIEVEARLNPRDRGLIAEGQPVRIKVTAYDFLRFGALEGSVLRIAADADQDPEEGSFFKMVVRTQGSVLGKSQLPVTAGMQADVDVVIGRQPFAWYLLRPVLKVGAEAFREP